MGSSQVDALLAELLSSDEEDNHEDEIITPQEQAGEDLEVWDSGEGLFEDSGDVELENELRRLRQKHQEEHQEEPSTEVTESSNVELGTSQSCDQFDDGHDKIAQPVQHVVTPTHVEPPRNAEPAENDSQESDKVTSLSEENGSPTSQQPSTQPAMSEKVFDPQPSQGLPSDEGETTDPNSEMNRASTTVILNTELKEDDAHHATFTQNTSSHMRREWSAMSTSIASRAQQAAENILQSKSSRDVEDKPEERSSDDDKIEHQEAQEVEEILSPKGATPHPFWNASYGSTIATPSASMNRIDEQSDVDVMHESSHEVEEHGPSHNPSSEAVPEWEQELLAAEAATQLLAEGEEKGATSGVKERLQEIMSSALQDWNPQGRPDAQGGMIGGSAAVRVTDQKDGLLANTLCDNTKYGSQRAICKSYHRPTGSPGYWYTAVGTSKSYVLVETATYAGPIGTQQATVELMELREGGGAEVTALGFSYSGEREKLLLVAGYIHGTLVVWDVAQKKMIATISGNFSPITSCCFLPNSVRAPSTIISADVSGVVCYHSLTSWVVRTGVNSKRVTSTARGPTLLSPMTPFAIPLRSGGERNVDPGANLIREDTVSICGEGMVCICAPGLCEIGRFCGDGKLLMLYRIPAPAEQPSHEIPCVNWAPNFPGFVRTFNEGGVPGAQLVVGWFGSVTLFDVPTVGDWIRHGDADVGQQGPRWNYRTTRPDPNEVRALTESAKRMPISIMGMWNPRDGPITGSMPFPTPEFPIIDLHWMAPGQLGALRKQGMLSQFLLFNTQLEVIEQVEIDDWPKSWKTVHNDYEYSWPYSSSAGLVSKLTMIGSRGLKAVRLMGWEECLEVLREIGKLKMCLHMGIHFFLQATQKALRGAHPGSAHLGTKDPALVAHRLSLLLMEYLDQVLAEEYTDDDERLSVINEAARLSTDLCILLKMTKALFQDVFPRFVSSGYEANFLETLEQTIVRNELNDGVAPEVVQALVEHCCDTGQPDKVERCVLRMDIASLDLNQVIRLCIGHNLFVALLYIFSQALMDVTTPVLHLINAIVHSSAKSEAETYTLKLLVYLRCCLQGLSYPPGSGKLPKEHERTIEKILGLLLFTNAQHLLDAQKSMQENSRRASASGESDAAELVELKGSFPVLRCLLTHKTEAVIWILRDVLSGWDCIEKDVLEAWSGGNVEEMYSVRTMTQVVVDALTELLASDAISNKTVIVEYICDCVGCGRALVCPEVAIELLEHLATKVKRDPEEKPIIEKLFSDIVESIGIQQHYDTDHRSSVSQLSPFQANQALNLASQSDMMQATALLHHLSGNFDQALKAVLHDKSQSNMTFKYISKSLEEFGKDSEQLLSMRKAIMLWMKELVKLDPQAAALMVLKNFPCDHQAIIQGLQGTRPLLFKYLKSAMEAAFSEDTLDTSSESYQGDVKNLDLSRLLTKEHCTMYMGLLCEFDPSSVLSFLRIRDHLVDVDQCKEWCKLYGIREGSAHLLEREGDINGALEMYLQEVESDNLALEEAVLSKDLSLDFLNSGRISRAQSLGFLVQENFGVTKRRQSQYIRNVPTVLSNTRKSLHAAVGLCQRNSKQLGLRKAAMQKQGMLVTGGPAMDHHVSMVELWFSLLKVYVDRVRFISQQAPQARVPLSPHNSLSSSMPSTPMSCISLHTITHHELRSMSSTASRINDSPKIGFLHDLYTAFMEEIISAMADYVPLQDIVRRIVIHHAHDRFGDFRSTLLGLMSAYNYEQSMLKSVHHLLNSDAYRTLLHCYNWRRKTCGVRTNSAVSEENVGSNADGEEAPAVSSVRNSLWLNPAADERGELVLSPGGDKSSMALKRRRRALIT